MPGRKPLPTNVKIFRGTQRKGRANENEPSYGPADMPPPDFLEGEARKEWIETCPRLVASGVMRNIDVNALAMYCESYGRWREALVEVKKNGMLIAAPSGFPMQNPYLPIANKAYEQMLKLAAEFGMTPSSRSKVSAGKESTPSNRFANNGRRPGA